MKPQHQHLSTWRRMIVKAMSDDDSFDNIVHTSIPANRAPPGKEWLNEEVDIKYGSDDPMPFFIWTTE